MNERRKDCAKKKEYTMKHIFKTTAIAALVATASLPAYAAAHMDVSTMTCDEYENLSRDDRNKVAIMAVTELSNSADTSATATPTVSATNESPQASTGTSAAGESAATGADRSATTTTISNAGSDMTRFEEEIKVMNGICTFNPTATVMEAAAGQTGRR